MPGRRRTGSIVERSPGHWRVRVDTRDRSGKRRAISRAVRGGRRDAERVLADMLAAKEEERRAPERDITLTDLVNLRYLPSLESGVVGASGRRYSLRTRQRYAYALKNHLLPHLGERRIRTITLEDLEWLRSRLMSSHLMDSTVADCLQVLSAAFSFAVRHNLLQTNPCQYLARPSRRPQRVVPRVDPEVARQVLDLASQTPLGPAAVLMLAHGLRREEALGLRWDDIDFDSQIITIRRALVAFARGKAELRPEPVWNLPKTGGSERRLPLLPGWTEYLREARTTQRRMRLKLGASWAGAGNPDSDQVVAMDDGRPWRPDSFTRAWRRFVQDAETALPALTPRDLRAGWVSIAYAVGADPKVASAWAGHSVPIARAHYQQVLTEQERSTRERLDLVFEGSRPEPTPQQPGESP